MLSPLEPRSLDAVAVRLHGVPRINRKAYDERRLQSRSSYLWVFRADHRSWGGCRSGGVPDNWLRAAGESLSEFRPPDRTALRYLPHRFSRAYPVRPPVQAARLYGWWRRIPDDAIPLVPHGE